MRHCVASRHWENRYEREIQIFYAEILYSRLVTEEESFFFLQFNFTKVSILLLKFNSRG